MPTIYVEVCLRRDLDRRKWRKSYVGIVAKPPICG